MEAARLAVIQESMVLARSTVVAVEILENGQLYFVCPPVLHVPLNGMITFLDVCFVKRD